MTDAAPPRPDTEARNLATVRAYLAAVADPDASFADLARHLDPEMVQEELPNLMAPAGARRDLNSMRTGHTRGRQVVTDQRWDVHHAFASGDRVAVELDWSGVLQVAAGDRPAGSTLRAHIALLFELRDGRIHRQRNYDCYRA